jgi:hypothetical protein
VAGALRHQSLQPIQLVRLGGLAAQLADLGRLARLKYGAEGINSPLFSRLPKPSEGMTLARLRYLSKSVPPMCTPPLARMSSRRSARPARSGASRTSAKSEVPPPMSTTSTSSSRLICDS